MTPASHGGLTEVLHRWDCGLRWATRRGQRFGNSVRIPCGYRGIGGLVVGAECLAGFMSGAPAALAEMGEDDLLAAAEACAETIRHAEVELLRIAYQWAIVHDPVG